jgi:AcrR family transcriptional regulator
MDSSKIRKIQELKLAGMSITAISKELHISRGSVYNYIE